MTETDRPRAEKLFAENKMAAAMPLFQALSTAEPSNVDVRMKLGICQFRTGDFATAEASFKTVTTERNDHHLAWYYLGLAQERQGRENEARTAYRFALTLKPDFAEAQKKLGEQAPASAAPPPAAPSQNPEKPKEPESLLHDPRLTRGLFTQQKSGFVYWLEKLSYFFGGLLFVGGVTGLMAAFITGIATQDNDAAIMIGLLVGAVVGLIFGIIAAGRVSRVI